MKLLSLFGLDRRLRQLRIAAGEGVMAAEDRAQLLQLSLTYAKERFGLVLALTIVVIGLTTIAVSMLSVAVVVHFWDTPHRTMAAWVVAAVWIAGWLVAAVGLVNSLRRSSGALEPSRQEFKRDWRWIRECLGVAKDVPRTTDHPTREELVERIARQRERIATLQAETPRAPEPAPSNEPISVLAVRVAREHPIATGVAATAAFAVLGPRRVLRWAAVIGPILWRMR